MTVEYVTIGEITVDDTVLESGEVRRSQTGGGSVYSALGIWLWGHRVGINSVVGHDYADAHLATLQDHGIATEGIHRIPGWSLRLWLLHEENEKKQQFPKLQSSSFQDLDAARLDPPDSYMGARGYHLSPATPEGQMRSRDVVRQRQRDAIISLDILTEPFVSFEAYRNSAPYRGVDVFSPSIVEIEALWPGERLEDVFRRLTNFGLRWIAIKMDIRGSVVHDARQGTTYRLPIYPARTVDTTGAGDAYSGGFLEGIVETGDVLEAGLRATVSASFAVEGWGAFGMLKADQTEAQNRLTWLKRQICT
jgi:sugar/nucleoside kinase (ribokinase family)